MNEINTTTISLSVDGEMFPVSFEMPFSPNVIIAHLSEFGGMTDVSNRFKPVLVPDRNGFVQLSADDILYIESDSMYSHIHFRNSRKITVSVPLGVLADDFCYRGIVRCHKSYAVNIREIDFIGGNSIWLRNETKIALGRTYKEKVHGCFNHRGTKSEKY